jgi:hypothetical protein
VPVAANCWVLSEEPVSIVWDEGETAIVDSVGWTKNPLQLTPVASATSTVKARDSASLRPVNIDDGLR